MIYNLNARNKHIIIAAGMLRGYYIVYCKYDLFNENKRNNARAHTHTGKEILESVALKD